MNYKNDDILYLTDEGVKHYMGQPIEKITFNSVPHPCDTEWICINIYYKDGKRKLMGCDKNWIYTSPYEVALNYLKKL